MRDATAWSKNHIIAVLQFTASRDSKTKRADYVGLQNYFHSKGIEDQTVPSIKAQIQNIVAITKKDQSYTAADLWSRGPRVLNLNHRIFQGLRIPADWHEFPPDKTIPKSNTENGADVQYPSLSNDVDETELVDTSASEITDGRTRKRTHSEDTEASPSPKRRKSSGDLELQPRPPQHQIEAIEEGNLLRACYTMNQTIGQAVRSHLEALGLERHMTHIDVVPWPLPLAALMRKVFGPDITPEKLADEITEARKRPLSLELLLRALVSAALVEWVMEPGLLAEYENPHSACGRLLDALKDEAEARDSTSTYNDMLFNAKIDLLQDEKRNIDKRSVALASDLIRLLSLFDRCSNHAPDVFIPRGDYLIS